MVESQRARINLNGYIDANDDDMTMVKLGSNLSPVLFCSGRGVSNTKVDLNI